MERQVSATHVVAFGCWVIGLGLVLIQISGDANLGQLGLMFVGAGIVLNVKAFLEDLERRERQAFEMGRQAGASDAVTHLRR